MKYQHRTNIKGMYEAHLWDEGVKDGGEYWKAVQDGVGKHQNRSATSIHLSTVP